MVDSCHEDLFDTMKCKMFLSTSPYISQLYITVIGTSILDMKALELD